MIEYSVFFVCVVVSCSASRLGPAARKFRIRINKRFLLRRVVSLRVFSCAVRRKNKDVSVVSLVPKIPELCVWARVAFRAALVQIPVIQQSRGCFIWHI